MHCDRSAKDQPPEIAMFRISEVQESPAFNGRLSFLTLRHEYVVLDTVEEFRQVHINAMAIPVSNRLLHLPGCVLSRASWSKTETRFRETRIEDRSQNLQDGLLNDTVHHVWNAEMPLSTIRFGNRLAPGRSRLVSPFQKLLSDRRPVGSTIIRELVDRNPIGTRSAFV